MKQVHTENAPPEVYPVNAGFFRHVRGVSDSNLPVCVATCTEWRTRMGNSVGKIWNHFHHDMSALPPDRMWFSFAAREDHLVYPRDSAPASPSRCALSTCEVAHSDSFKDLRNSLRRGNGSGKA